VNLVIFAEEPVAALLKRLGRPAVGTRNLKLGIWWLNPFNIFTRRLFDKAFYILSINWKRKTSLCRSTYPIRGL